MKSEKDRIQEFNLVLSGERLMSSLKTKVIPRSQRHLLTGGSDENQEVKMIMNTDKQRRWPSRDTALFW